MSAFVDCKHCSNQIKMPSGCSEEVNRAATLTDKSGADLMPMHCEECNRSYFYSLADLYWFGQRRFGGTVRDPCALEGLLAKLEGREGD